MSCHCHPCPELLVNYKFSDFTTTQYNSDSGTAGNLFEQQAVGSGGHIVNFFVTSQSIGGGAFRSVERVTIIKANKPIRQAVFYTTTDTQGATKVGDYYDCINKAKFVVFGNGDRALEFY